MLTKAILTGGVLSVLAGSIVYFGTEGADASVNEAKEAVRAEETDLAGAADVAVGVVEAEIEADVKVEAKVETVVEAQDPPAKESQPKTKWLDQYLKKTKSEDKSEVKSEPKEDAVLDEPAVKVEDKEPIRVKKLIKRDSASGEAKGTYVVSEGSRVETLDIDEDIDIQILRDRLDLDADKNIEVRVIRKMIDGKTVSHSDLKSKERTDYAPILAEAKKLLVTDMRNQAYLEIVDHAVDQGDMIQAADIVEELSTPELRDTARARIGTGLARRGKTEAAFAVLDELEIDELSAPIRLEIITALMATKQERETFAFQR